MPDLHARRHRWLILAGNDGRVLEGWRGGAAESQCEPARERSEEHHAEQQAPHDALPVDPHGPPPPCVATYRLTISPQQSSAGGLSCTALSFADQSRLVAAIRAATSAW